MIELKVLDQKYSCRTQEHLWYRETVQAIRLVVEEHKTIPEIRKLAETENIFNSISLSRSKDLSRAVLRRLESVDEEFYNFFAVTDSETQLQLCVVMVMLTDHTFYDFMDLVFREKLITRDEILHDSDVIGFFHQLQDKDERASRWTDEAMKKASRNYKGILKDANMLSEGIRDRNIIRPILRKETEDFLNREGLSRIYKILAGERE